MGILTNAFDLTERQRKAVAFLIAVLLLTSVRVQAAEITTSSILATQWETGQSIHDYSRPMGIAVPESFSGELNEAKDIPPIRVSYVTITSYSSVPWQTDDSPFITADGSRVKDGIVAANFLKLGTRIRIPELFGDKIFEVHDRMHPRFSNRVDIWMPSVAESRRFGIKRGIKIEILN